MKKLTTQIILSFLSCILSSAALAEESANAGATAAKTDVAYENQNVSPDVELVKDYCPPVETLVRDPVKQLWVGPHGWVDKSPSFLHSLDTFAGAQWIGVGVGEIICVYLKTTRNSFPVTLQRGKLAPAPKIGAEWSAHKNGYLECKSNNVQNCPFFSQIPKPPKNVYEQLDFYKGIPTEND